MKQISELVDLFGNTRFVKSDGKVLNERSTLIKYFVDRAQDKNGKPFEPSYIGMRLSHLKLPDLYYLQSVCESESRRGQPWNKIFFGMLKV